MGDTLQMAEKIIAFVEKMKKGDVRGNVIDHIDHYSVCRAVEGTLGAVRQVLGKASG